ncbi:glycoside hydrolase family 32 protein [Marinilabilia rubra]|uniref:Glycosyl hydrolase family 32 n=1 Tax=Marinilabilia rubra TaxID=2162893 RepID=A0A2U2B9R9_9BACT|nr:glycoside hydrolase family 32 protein [Marinilabilia rubra]PWD99821.1 glycosyl hydrolase family 32 [Marinilabilia rubra]
MRTVFLILFVLFGLGACNVPQKDKGTSGMKSGLMSEQWRPQIHFTPKAQWMNDPNGMVYHDGEYHLFYQYHPNSNVWGPMHWGHAISEDLIHWEHLPIGLYPDSLGTIFSGSAVADVDNTSGFGKNGKTPLVAVYTNHSHEKESEGRIDYQTQSIAYSLDNGRTWTKYEKNPVLDNPGIRDFRDPKVRWHEPTQKWIMTLAVKDRVSFYSSPDLKEWTFESSFAQDEEHNGVVECPDLFPLNYNGQEKWVLFISLNPGFLHGGSGTKYYIGEFDGKEFIPDDPNAPTHWFDYGKDNYAGVTWSNIPEEDGRTLFIGWMSNWQYATVVPTEQWRSAMTLPRSLELVEGAGGKPVLKGEVVNTIENIAGDWQEKSDLPVAAAEAGTLEFSFEEDAAYQLSLEFDIQMDATATIDLYNEAGDSIFITLDKNRELVVFDRIDSGETTFNENFPGKYDAPVAFEGPVKVDLYVDQSSVEMFINGGKVQMTNLVFPETLLTGVEIYGSGDSQLITAKARVLNSIWK